MYKTNLPKPKLFTYYHAVYSVCCFFMKETTDLSSDRSITNNFTITSLQR